MEISFYLLDLPVIHRVFPINLISLNHCTDLFTIEGNLLQLTFCMEGDVLIYTGIFKCLCQDFNTQAENFLLTDLKLQLTRLTVFLCDTNALHFSHL